MLPALSVVVVAYGMARELPRSLRSLSRHHQRDVDDLTYEVIVVDNGSPTPLTEHWPDGLEGRWLRIDSAPPSPVMAANIGIGCARADVVGLIVDGARIASPRLLATALEASRLGDPSIVTAPAYHLGPDVHIRATETGYDAQAEDELLRRSGWEADGYELFSVSTLAASSGRGWFGPMGESSSLFMRRSAWDELGGLDERFALPGGGLANHDLYGRACRLSGARLVVLSGEGTFHQLHGGAATSGRFGWSEMHEEYLSIRGEPHRPPANQPTFFGQIPHQAMIHAERSAQLAIERRARQSLRRSGT